MLVGLGVLEVVVMKNVSGTLKKNANTMLVKLTRATVQEVYDKVYKDSYGVALFASTLSGKNTDSLKDEETFT